MESHEIQEEVEELETRIERLRALYEQYFMGIERTEPMTARKDVDRRIWVLRREQIRNSGLRFRFQMMVQRYNTFQQYWGRITREIDSGTYRRDVLKVASRFGEKEALTILGRKRAEKYKVLAAAQKARAAREEAEAAEAKGEKPSERPARLSSRPPRKSDVPPGPTRRSVTPPPGRKVTEPPKPLPELAEDEHPFGVVMPTATPSAPARMAPPPSRSGAAGQAIPPPRGTQPGGMAAPKPPLPPGARPPLPAGAASAPAIPGRPGPPPVPSRPGMPAVRPGAAPAPVASASGAGNPAPARPAGPAAPPAAAAKPPLPSAAAKPAAPVAPKPATPPSAPRDDGGLPDQRLRQIYAKYVETKRAANESTAGLTYDKLAESLRAQAAKLRATHQSKSVDYDVVVKDGKTLIKPVLR